LSCASLGLQSQQRQLQKQLTSLNTGAALKHLKEKSWRRNRIGHDQSHSYERQVTGPNDSTALAPSIA
jgi:hypothetical protein